MTQTLTPNILLVDDTPANLKVLFELLEPENLDLRVANSGETALKSLQIQVADLILLDVNMPGIDGFETCRQIKANPNLAEIPVIFMTALDNPEHKVMAFDLGAVDYITKPFEAQEVLARIRNHLRLKQASIKLQEQSTQLANKNAELETLIEEQTQALWESGSILLQITETINSFVWMTNADLSQMLYVSPAFEKIWGHSVKELYKNPKLRLELIHPDDKDRVIEAITPRIQGATELEYRIIRPSGEIRWVRERGFPIRDHDGEIHRLAGVSEDITQEKRMEQSILSTLAKEQKLNDLKSQFITTTSHEFRTPLSVISNNAELLKFFADKLSKEEREDSLNTITKYIDKCIKLLESLLLWDDIEAQKITLQPTSLELTGFVESLEKQYQAEFIKNSIHSHCYDKRTKTDSSPIVTWDPKLIRQTLKAIVKNSVQFSENADVVDLQVLMENEQVVITIIDSGSGIDPVDLPHIFEPFYRGKTTGNISGGGMGLAIAKRLVSMHQGTIECNNNADVGTTCKIILPWSTTDPLNTPPKSTSINT